MGNNWENKAEMAAETDTAVCIEQSTDARISVRPTSVLIDLRHRERGHVGCVWGDPFFSETEIHSDYKSRLEIGHISTNCRGLFVWVRAETSQEQ